MRLIAVWSTALVVAAALTAVVANRHDRESASAPAASNAALAAEATPAAGVVPRRPGPHAVDPATLRRKGDFRGVDGRAYSVFEGKTNDGANRCAVTVGGGFSDVVCDPTPFADSPIEFGESYAAGPSGSPVHEWRVSGIAREDVRRIILVNSVGKTRQVQLTSDGAFFFDLPQSDIARGISAVSLLVYDGDGKLIKEVGL